MTPTEYFEKTTALLNVFSERLLASHKFFASGVDFTRPEILDEYWALETAANDAAQTWIDFCNRERHRVDDL